MIEERAPAEVAGTLIDLLAVYAARWLGAETALETIGRVLMSKDLVEESPLYQQWMREGREEGMRATALALWRARFGEPAADVVAVIEGLHDAGKLIELAVTVSGTSDLTVARALLGLGAQN
jgi:hypothetical protein